MSMAGNAGLFRFEGTIVDLTDAERASLFGRGSELDQDIASAAARIIADVRLRGDEALVEMARLLDGVELRNIEVSRARRIAALMEIEPGLQSALERAAGNIGRAHATGLPAATETETEPGVVVGRRPDPYDRVGIYAPGGTAAYASSVLMAAVPARAAGVAEIIVCSPPGRDGLPAALVLAACEIAGVDRVFAIGGAGAIAAMAFGTETVPRVHKVVGPGNAYVAAAKLQVSNRVAIDCPAGPSELLVLCDATADAAVVAREIVAQAEHDRNAAVAVVTIGEMDACNLIAELEIALEGLERADIARDSLSTTGALLSAKNLQEAICFAESYAPEHLLLAIADAESALPLIRNSGCIFVGESSSVVFGDYISGGNHVLPTAGLARSYSGLGAADFIRWTGYQRLTRAGAQSLSDDTALLSAAEGLAGHARAARAWSDSR